MAVVRVVIRGRHPTALVGRLVLADPEIEVAVAVDVAGGHGHRHGEGRAHPDGRRAGEGAAGVAGEDAQRAVAPDAGEIRVPVAIEVGEDGGLEDRGKEGAELLGSRELAVAVPRDLVAPGDNDLRIAVAAQVVDEDGIGEQIGRNVGGLEARRRGEDRRPGAPDHNGVRGVGEPGEERGSIGSWVPTRPPGCPSR